MEMRILALTGFAGPFRIHPLLQRPTKTSSFNYFVICEGPFTAWFRILWSKMAKWTDSGTLSTILVLIISFTELNRCLMIQCGAVLLPFKGIRIPLL
jgi:hypothetical protein